MVTFSMLLVLCEGNSQFTREFPSKRSVIQSFDVCFDLCQTNGWVNNWDARDLRRYHAHYDVIVMWYHSCYYFQIKIHPDASQRSLDRTNSIKCTLKISTLQYITVFNIVTSHFKLFDKVLCSHWYIVQKLKWYINGLVQDRCNSSALAMELHLSCTKLLIWWRIAHHDQCTIYLN